MDYAKVQMEAIKAQLLRDDGDVTVKIAYDDMCGENTIGILASAYHFYLVPRHKFYLDAEKFEKVVICQKAMESARCADPLMYNGITKKRNYRKSAKTVIVLYPNDGDEVWLDEKIVKKFGNPDDLTYSGRDAKSVVYIMRNGFYLGAIMPVNYKND